MALGKPTQGAIVEQIGSKWITGARLWFETASKSAKYCGCFKDVEGFLTWTLGSGEVDCVCSLIQYFGVDEDDTNQRMNENYR